MKGKIFFLSILLLFPMSIKALDCTYSEQARLRNIASNVTATYEFQENDDNPTFNITLTNFTNELYLVDSYNNIAYYSNGTNEITFYGYKPGSKIKYTIYPTRGNCTYSYLINFYVNLPYYNKYYKDELCLNKDYSICNKWQNINLTYDEFKKKIEELETKEEIEIIEEKEEISMLDYISSFIFKYYPYILIGMVLLGVGVEYVVKKKNDFGF